MDFKTLCDVDMHFGILHDNLVKFEIMKTFECLPEKFVCFPSIEGTQRFPNDDH